MQKRVEQRTSTFIIVNSTAQTSNPNPRISTVHPMQQACVPCSFPSHFVTRGCREASLAARTVHTGVRRRSCTDYWPWLATARRPVVAWLTRGRVPGRQLTGNVYCREGVAGFLLARSKRLGMPFTGFDGFGPPRRYLERSRRLNGRKLSK